MSARPRARALRPKQLRVGQVLRHAIYDTRWLVLARDLGGQHPYEGVQPDYSKRPGVLLRYIDPELGLGDVLDHRQRRRVVDRSLVPLSQQQDLELRFTRDIHEDPWEVFERTIGDTLVDYWEVLPDAPCPADPEVMLERARRRREAADILQRLTNQIGDAAAALREVGEELPTEEHRAVEVVREGDEPNHYTHACSPSVWGPGSHQMRVCINELRREAAQLDEWSRLRAPGSRRPARQA